MKEWKVLYNLPKQPWYKEGMTDLKHFSSCPQDGIEALSNMDASFDGSMAGWTWPRPTAMPRPPFHNPTLEGLWAIALEKAVKALSCDILTRILVEQQRNLQYKRLY